MLYNLGVKAGWGARGLDRKGLEVCGARQWGGDANLIGMEGSSTGELVKLTDYRNFEWV